MEVSQLSGTFLIFDNNFSSMMHRKVIITSVTGTTSLSVVQPECLGKKSSQKS